MTGNAEAEVKDAAGRDKEAARSRYAPPVSRCQRPGIEPRATPGNRTPMAESRGNGFIPSPECSLNK